MDRKEIKKLLEVVQVEVEKTRHWFEKAHQSANEVAVVSANSPSQSGDRYHSRNQAELNREVLNNLVKLKKELSNSLNLNISEVRPPCYVRLESDKGELKEIYLVENAVNLTGFAIATILSPIGQELIGKKVGDSANLNFGKMKIVKIN